jgi:hypothetical protein
LLEDHLGGPEKMEVYGELTLELGYILASVVDHIDTREDLAIEVLLESVEKGQAEGLDGTEEHVEYVVGVILVLDDLLVLEVLLSLDLMHWVYVLYLNGG